MINNQVQGFNLGGDMSKSEYTCTTLLLEPQVIEKNE